MTSRDSSNSGQQVANNPDYAPVCIFFEDEDINQIFSELLEARGIHTQILDNLKNLPGQTKIITEPQYFPQLDSSCRDKCLIVGNKDALQGISALSLSRPLTEEKIEQALSQLLRA